MKMLDAWLDRGRTNLKKGLFVVLLVGCLTGQASTQTPTVGFVLNDASFEPLLSPGTGAAIFGQNLARETCILTRGSGSAVSIRGKPWPKSLCDVRVLVGEKEAALVLVSDRQIGLQIPLEAEPGETAVVVEVLGDRSEPFPITLETHAPGLYSARSTGRDLGAFFAAEAGPPRFDDFVPTVPINEENPADPGEGIGAFANGLGPTDNWVPTGQPAPTTPLARTVTNPVPRIGCLESSVLFSGLRPETVVQYQVTLRVPENTPGGNHPVTLEIGGQTSNEVILPVSGEEIPFVCSAVSAASFEADAPAAPGSIMSLFAMNIGERENLSAFPAVDFNDMSVTFNSLPAPLFAVVPANGQINLLAPTELPETGEVEVRITNAIGESMAFSLELTAANPGIFRVTDPSEPDRIFGAALLNGTRWFALPASTAAALGLPTDCAEQRINPASFCAQPVAAGDFIQIFVTGMGRATIGRNPAGAVLPTGELAPVDANRLYETVMNPQVTFGGVPGEVFFSGLAPGFSGLYQITVQVPVGAPTGDEVQLTVSMANGRSDSASIAIRAGP